MKSASIITTLMLSVCVLLGADDDGKDELKVKINNRYSFEDERHAIQFNYDTKEVLQITNELEQFRSGLFFPKREELKDFKIFLGKVLKLCDTIHKERITGVKREYEDKGGHLPISIWYGVVEISEDASPSYKSSIEINLRPSATRKNIKTGEYDYIPGFSEFNPPQSFDCTYPELEELARVIDVKSAEVYKKYDILKKLRD